MPSATGIPSFSLGVSRQPGENLIQTGVLRATEENLIHIKVQSPTGDSIIQTIAALGHYRFPHSHQGAIAHLGKLQIDRGRGGLTVGSIIHPKDAIATVYSIIQPNGALDHYQFPYYRPGMRSPTGVPSFRPVCAGPLSIPSVLRVASLRL